MSLYIDRKFTLISFDRDFGPGKKKQPGWLLESHSGNLQTTLDQLNNGRAAHNRIFGKPTLTVIVKVFVHIWTDA